jgi:hypothetical protein
VWPWLCVLGPSRVERVGGQDTAQVTQTRNKGGGCCHSDFSMAELEDLVGPRHANRHSRSETKANQEHSAVPSPVFRKGSHQETGNLDHDGAAEEPRAVAMKTVGEWSDEENRKSVHLRILDKVSVGSALTYKPDGRREQTELNASQFRVDASNDDSRICLCSVAHSNDSKVHDHQGVESPVGDDVPQIFHVPRAAVVDSRQILVVNPRIFACQSWLGLGQKLEPTTSIANFARWKRPIRKPEKERDTDEEANDTVEQEHPLKSDKATHAVHLLKACRYQAHDSRRDL